MIDALTDTAARLGGVTTERLSKRLIGALHSATLIEKLRWVNDRLAEGKAIGSLICDGRLVQDDPPQRNKPAKGAGIDFSSLAAPTTAEGRRLRKQLEDAIRAGDDGQIALVQSLAVRLRPGEREAAVTAVLRAALSQ